MAAVKGRVLVVSCSEFMSSLNAIKQIHGKDHLPDSSNVTDIVDAIPWTIHTKYFDVDIELCYRKLDDKAKISDSFPVCEGIIIVFDQSKLSSFKEVQSWGKYIESVAETPSVLLLLNTGHVDSTQVSKKEVLEWCLKNSFELVELNPDDDDEEEAGEFGEQTGFGRVVQALQCGEWPNIRIKGETNKEDKCISNDKQQTTNELKEAKTDSMEQATAQSVDPQPQNKNTQDCTDPDLELLSRLDDANGEESFEELFQRLHAMKERAVSLPDEQRKSYAEKVAMAFWRAMGGDEDEISGLSDDND